LYNNAKDLQNIPHQNFDIVIIDDGLHGGLIAPSQTIILWDGALGYKNKLPFPAGGFRCLPSNPFIKADAHFAILPQGMDKPVNQQLFAKIPNLYTAKTSLHFDSEVSLDLLQKSKLLAFCGLARPQKFYQSLDILGVKPLKTISFADHYPYTQQDALRLLSYKKDGFNLITTAKDIVKIEHLIGKEHGFNVLQISTLFNCDLFD
jgi:tetraacyldisaccharide 4'-kinase